MDETTVREQSPRYVSAFDWMPPAGAHRALRVLHHVVTALNFGGSLLCCLVAGRMMEPGVGWAFGWVTWVCLLYAAVAVHELGHYGGARLMGMTTLSAHCGPLEFFARRRGFRWRWRWIKRQSLGGVFAVPDPTRDFRSQLVWLAAAGPLAGLAVGLASLMAGLRMDDGPLQGFAFGFSVLNLGFALSALVPCMASAGTDGLAILRARRLTAADPALVALKLNGLALAGTTADRLPAADIERLGTLPEPCALFRLWFLLKGHQNRAQWREAAAMDAELEPCESALSEPMRAAMGDLIALMRCEIRFSGLMAGNEDIQSPVEPLTPELDWTSPAVRPRCLAAVAAREGRTKDANAWLAEAEREAEASFDAAARISEGRLRDAIRATMAVPVP